MRRCMTRSSRGGLTVSLDRVERPAGIATGAIRDGPPDLARSSRRRRTCRHAVQGVPGDRDQDPLVPAHRRRQPRRPAHRRRRPPPRAVARTTWPRSPGRVTDWASTRCSRRAAPACEDAWITTASLIPLTRTPAVPGRVPTRAAQPDARRTDGVDLPAHVRRTTAASTSSSAPKPAELARFGDFSSKDERYERAGEFLDGHRRRVGRRAVRLRRRALPGAGRHDPASHPTPDPRSTSAAPRRRPRQVAAASRRRLPGVGRDARHDRRAPGPDAAAAPMRAGRPRGPAAALRHPLPRHHPRHRRRGVGRGRPPDVGHRPRRRPRRHGPTSTRPSPRGSAAWPRCPRPRAGDGAVPDDPTILEVYPNLWTGVGLVRGGAGTALVGSHEQVADRIEEYRDAGHRRVHPVGLPAPGGGLPHAARDCCPSCGPASWCPPRRAGDDRTVLLVPLTRRRDVRTGPAPMPTRRDAADRAAAVRPPRRRRRRRGRRLHRALPRRVRPRPDCDLRVYDVTRGELPHVTRRVRRLDRVGLAPLGLRGRAVDPPTSRI